MQLLMPDRPKVRDQTKKDMEVEFRDARLLIRRDSASEPATAELWKTTPPFKKSQAEVSTMEGARVNYLPVSK